MKDENGKVTIEGYYDGIEITPDVKKILDSTLTMKWNYWTCSKLQVLIK